MSSLNQKTSIEFLQKDGICLLILLFFVFCLISPTFLWGIPDGFDLPQHFQFAATYLDSIKSGNLILNWSSQTNYGFGDVGLRFYPPLAHYLLAFTQLITNDWFITGWTNICFWMALGSIGIYFFSREFLTTQNSLLVGILYSIAPYHLSQIYQYFLYSEFAAAGILPFCFLYLTKINRVGKPQDVLLLSFFSALLILTHIPTTIIGAISLSLYALIILDWEKKYKVLPQLFLSGLLTLFLTSFYWIKLITEVQWVNHTDPKYSSFGLYDYKSSFFPFFSNLNELYFIKQLWFRDIVGTITYFMILPILLLIILKFFQRKNLNKELLGISAVAIFSALMSTSISSMLWENFSFLQKLQFPYRWLSVTTLLGSLSLVIFFQSLNTQNLQTIAKYGLILFFAGLAIFNITQIILPAGLLGREQFEGKIANSSSEESFDCWWTIWSKKEAFNQKEKVISGSRKIEITRWEAENRKFTVEVGDIESARIATFYYPHWQAFVNQQKVEINRNDDGTINIPLPKEPAEVSLIFVEPFLLKFAKIISLISWLAIIFLSLSILIKTKTFQLNQ